MGAWDSLVGILGLAFGLGLVHALDADHIAAVSALASRGDGQAKHAWRFCLRWALGHGGTLMLLGIAVLAIGIHLPPAINHYAEAAVGVLLLVMAGALFNDIRRQSLRLGFHTHPGLPHHAHWQRSTHAGDGHRHEHGATLVGALHGAAGSAPLLALIPIATQQTPAWGLAYLLLFSLGVLASMLVFGGLLSALFARLAGWGRGALQWTRSIIAGGSLAAGLYVLHGLS